MSLPRQVQQQADAAARFYETPGNTDESGAQNNGAPPAPENVHENDDAQTAGKPDSSDEQERHAEHRPADDRSDDASYWRHRLDISEGRLRSASDENRKLKETIQQRDERIAQLESSNGGDAGNLTPQEVTNIEQLKEEYGSDLIGAVQQMIESRVPKGNASDQRLEDVERRLQQDEQQRNDDQRARFWQRLTQRVPNYQQINGDQAFLQWLGGIDRLSGVTRQQLLDDAAQKFDPERVADIFEAYSSGTQASSKKGGGKPDNAENPEDREVPPDQVQPRQSRSTSAPQGAHIWTRNEIAQYYRDRREGRYDEAEAKRIEADIFSAQQQGRVQ